MKWLEVEIGLSDELRLWERNEWQTYSDKTEMGRDNI